MILVTGGTGFIGQALVRRLVENGHEVRTLLRPAASSPRLPRGVPVEAAVTSLNDPRGLRAAMSGVEVVYHLASGEWRGPQADLDAIDVGGTRAVAQAAREAGVKRLFLVSHLGAALESGYPVLRAKALAESAVRASGVDFTILRAAIVFGRGDGLTTGLAQLLASNPFFFFLPGEGHVLLQPLWVEDLVTALVWALDDPNTRNQLYEVGGPEFLSFRQIVEFVMTATGQRRRLVSLPPPYLRGLTVWLDARYPRLPVSVYWLDYLAAPRTCALDTLPRQFNLMPARFSKRLAYLERQDWRAAWRANTARPRRRRSSPEQTP